MIIFAFLLLHQVAAILCDVSDQAEAAIKSTWIVSSSLPSVLHTGNIGCGFVSGTNCSSCNQGKLIFSIYMQADDGASYVTWSANRDRPVPLNSSLELRSDGNLVIKDSDGTQVWETNTAGLGVVGMKLLAPGNLVLVNKKQDVIWESFQSPTDTLLPGQQLKVGNKLWSSISRSNLSQGYFYLEVERTQVTLRVQTQAPFPPQTYGSSCRNQEDISYIMLYNGTIGCYNSSKYLLSTMITGTEKLVTIYPDGSLLDPSVQQLQKDVRNLCQRNPGQCGAFGICKNDNCSCPSQHFSFVDPKKTHQGCSHNAPLVCGNDHEFVELSGVDYIPARYERQNHASSEVSVNECRSMCLKNCSCKAFVFYKSSTSTGNACSLLTEVFTLYNSSARTTSFIKIASQKKVSIGSNAHSKIVANHQSRSPAFVMAIIILSFGMVLLIALISFYTGKRFLKQSKEPKPGGNQISMVPNLPKHFAYMELSRMTNNFNNKIGEGGYGTVFKGTTSDGVKVAIKCLEGARQGLKQFEAEVMTIGSIHHKNLVKLLGYGAENSCYYLIYEYMPKLSLDKWIFELEALTLDWNMRFNIAIDIARGLHYLHEECQERILHLDIKPQNILLDVDFEAKICDFGLAKLMNKGDNYIHTMIRGTPGYMAPEWLNSKVTEKADVYSYGIVLLEIVSGRKTVPLQTGYSTASLMRAQAFEQEVNIEEHIDARIHGTIDFQQLRTVIKVGLSCIQDNPLDRPSMGNVLKQLEASLALLPILVTDV